MMGTGLDAHGEGPAGTSLRGGRGKEITLRIAMLSDNESHGGAAVAASRLATALTAAGAEVTRIVARPDGAGHPWRTVGLGLRLWQTVAVVALRRIARATGMRLEQRLLEMQLSRLLRALEPDIVNVHNLHAAGWGSGLVRACALAAPTVWTLHDMWSFTGRCTYAYDCDLFTRGCDASCPTAAEYPVLAPAQIAPAWRRRRDVLLGRHPVAAVAPSRWLVAEARRGLWRDRRVDVIPNGVPLETFTPLDRHVARRALALPADGPVVLLAAERLDERRKGAERSQPALEACAHGAATVVTVGSGAVRAEGGRVIALGFLRDERSLALAYAAADLLLHPAPVDNLPNTVLEAMACGTPAVAFPIGGVPELVRPGSTGWLAESTTPEALARAVDSALGAVGAGDDRRTACRATAEREYGLPLQAQRYLTRFRDLTQSRE